MVVPTRGEQLGKGSRTLVYSRPMRPLVALWVVLGLLVCAMSAGASAQAATCHAHAGLPDRDCTPGARDSRVTQANVDRTICVSGWTKRVRPPTSVTTPIKVRREIAYGIPAPHPKPFRVEELDHLIPLELGGAPKAIRNLWPEAAAGTWGYHRKDVLETRLKQLVCTHQVDLRTAQRAIARDWIAAYRRHWTPISAGVRGFVLGGRSGPRASQGSPREH
jgi:hypothetical protein